MVYAALASCRSGPGESGVSLEERVAKLEAAVLQVGKDAQAHPGLGTGRCTPAALTFL